MQKHDIKPSHSDTYTETLLPHNTNNPVYTTDILNEEKMMKELDDRKWSGIGNKI